jgi:trk system potassium uptake protein TrkA
MVKAKRVLVIGVGRFGSALIETLWKGRAEVVAVDARAAAVEPFREKTSHAFVGDAADPKVLEGLGAADFDAVVVTFGMAFEATVLCVATLRRMGADHVIARAETQRQADVLHAVGASRVVQLEWESGRRIGRDLLSPIEEDLFALVEDYRIVPWQARGALAGQSLADAEFRKRHGLTVIGYRTAGTASRIALPGPDYVIREGDTLLLVGDEAAVGRFLDTAGAPDD